MDQRSSFTSASIYWNKEMKTRLTNLNKVFWPREGITKGNLIEYYQQIAPMMLPHLLDRPESLHRHPNGINGDSFFQKNFTFSPPKYVSIKAIHSEHKQQEIRFLLCQNESTLIYLAQLGCIEINPWLSRIKKLDHPDFCVIDLDPEKIGFAAVVKTAQAVHRLLTKAKIDNFCKTSGATGLHIYIPLGAKYTYQQSSQFAELIANIVHSQLPKITSIDRLPATRQGKVYIDFLQNNRGQTIAAPYSLRPRPHAPVSTPLRWREVNQKLTPLKFTIRTILPRVKKLGDIWAPLLKHKGINLLASIDRLQKFIKN